MRRELIAFQRKANGIGSTAAGLEVLDTKEMPTAKVTRIGVIGDVHGRTALLRRALNALFREPIDAAACVGDIVGVPKATDETCAMLAENNVLAVRGNHDRWLLEDESVGQRTGTAIAPSSRTFLSELPPYRLVDTIAGTIMICHGFASNDLGVLPESFPHSFVRRALRLGSLPLGCAAMFFGHSHLKRVQVCEGIQFVGVGTLSADANAGCVVFDSLTGTASFLNY